MVSNTNYFCISSLKRLVLHLWKESLCIPFPGGDWLIIYHTDPEANTVILSFLFPHVPSVSCTCGISQAPILNCHINAFSDLQGRDINLRRRNRFVLDTWSHSLRWPVPLYDDGTCVKVSSKFHGAGGQLGFWADSRCLFEVLSYGCDQIWMCFTKSVDNPAGWRQVTDVFFFSPLWHLRNKVEIDFTEVTAEVVTIVIYMLACSRCSSRAL